MQSAPAAVAVAEVRQSWLPIDGMDIEVLESSGSGTPIFVFHGNSSSAHSFRPLLSGPLGQRHRMIAVSFPGHGASSPASDHQTFYTIEGLGRLAARVVDTYEFDRYFLIGQSLGGHAILEALDRFTHCSGLVLLSAPPISLNTLQLAFKPDPSHGSLFKGQLSDAEVAQLASCFSAGHDARALAVLENAIRTTDVHFRPALGASLAAGKVKDEWAALAAAPFPVALLLGDEDQFLQADYSTLLQSLPLWGGQAQVFAGQHALHLDAPEQFSAMVAKFVSQVEQDAGRPA